jgi:ParB family transcriptional regulator, chromosome partitioning protein
MPAKKRKPSGTPRKRRGVKLKPTDLAPKDLAVVVMPDEIHDLAAAVDRDGGAVLATYREPLGGHIVLLCALPIDKVAPTPFQRDVSDAHVRRLTQAMDKTKRFLDPVIAVREERAGTDGDEDGQKVYWIPNGYHRLTALQELGAKTLLALVVPETAVAYQILALNIEKAHNLRERALGVARMYRDLIGTSRKTEREDSLALEFEEAALPTLGFAYEKRPRLSGGAYHPVLRKSDAWIERPLEKALAEREARAAALLELDDAVGAIVDKLKKRGFQSPYLRPFVIARINPLRFLKGKAPAVEDLLGDMTKRARGMNVDRIKAEDVARTGGAPEASE